MQRVYVCVTQRCVMHWSTASLCYPNEMIGQCKRALNRQQPAFGNSLMWPLSHSERIMHSHIQTHAFYSHTYCSFNAHAGTHSACFLFCPYAFNNTKTYRCSSVTYLSRELLTFYFSVSCFQNSVVFIASYFFPGSGGAEWQSVLFLSHTGRGRLAFRARK